MVKTINILGATGSIGRSAVDVIGPQPEQFSVQVVTAHTDAAGLVDVATKLNARHVVLSDSENIDTLRNSNLKNHPGIKMFGGAKALDEAAAVPADITLAAIMGMAGLKPLIAAIENSEVVAIANKEPLVSAGPIVLAHAARHGTHILPVDSEHNAIFQVFDGKCKDDVERIVLTASGGPFRTWTKEQMRAATPSQAVAHPNWSMGKKISVDSATMMNKALEVIEAHYLFGVAAEKIEVLIHPQSIIHGMVEYKDGSVLSQMGPSDMRTPLANVLNWPERLQSPGKRLDWAEIGGLTFEPVDHVRFPAVRIAYEALDAGLWACAAINAANEVAVAAFLNQEIGFTDIVDVAQYVLDHADHETLSTLEDVCAYDESVRAQAKTYIRNIHNKKVMVAS